MSVSVCGVEDNKSPIQCYVSDDSGPLPGLYKYTRLLFTSVTSIRRARASGLQADCVSELWGLHKMFYERKIFKFTLCFSVLLGFIAFHLPQIIVNNENPSRKLRGRDVVDCWRCSASLAYQVCCKWGWFDLKQIFWKLYFRHQDIFCRDLTVKRQKIE